MNRKQSLSNLRINKKGVLVLMIASILMLSLGANVGATIVDLTPDYAMPGALIDILSWDIYAPGTGTNLSQIVFRYNGTNVNDLNYTQFYANDTLLSTVYLVGPVFFVPAYVIPANAMVTITMKFKVSDTATHGNFVDGYIENYVLTLPGAGGTDGPADPNGYTIIDNINPTLNKTLEGTTGNTPWWISEVNVTLTAGDAHSGVDTVEYNLNSGGWTPYTASFNISAEGNNTLAHRVNDTAGNMYTKPTQYIPIDTIAPTASSIVVSDDFIKEDDVPGTFNVTVTFSEAMNPLVFPSIDFDPVVNTTLVNETGAWSVGDMVYTFTYDIADANVTVYDVNVTVGGAEDVAGNPDPTTVPNLFDIDTLHKAGFPEYIDVWAEYSAPMSITLNANEVAWPMEGIPSEWNSPEEALVSDDEYAFLTKNTGSILDKDITLRLNFEAPPEDLDGYKITSVKLKVEQKIISDYYKYTDDTWEFGVGDKHQLLDWCWDTWIYRPGTVEENTMSIDITYEWWLIFPVHKLTWDDLNDIAVVIKPEHDKSQSGEWYIDNVWIEVNYIYEVEGPSITVPVDGEAKVFAEVTDWFNATVPDGTEIHFVTDIGTMFPVTDLTVDGMAMSTIRSTDVGNATVEASGSLNGICYVNFVATTLDIDLSPGWNLVSVPRELENSSIEAVFDGITSITKIYTYQNGNWSGSAYNGTWNELISGHPIEDIEDGIGYWVYTTEPTTVTLSLEPLGYVEVIPPDYDLSMGWTMIGYTTLQLEQEMPVPVYLTNLDGIWQSMYNYAPATGYDQAKPDYGFDNTELGRGYWIYLNDVGVLVP